MNLNDAQDSQESKNITGNEVISWVCPKCQTINRENKCIVCGYTVKMRPVSRKWNTGFFKFIPVVLVVLLLLAVVGSTAAKSEAGATFLRELHCITGHEYSEATCTEAPTCVNCGKIEGEALGHDYSKPTCTKYAKCSRCGDTTGSLLSHTWKEATYEKPKTCTVCGKTTGKVKGYYEKLPGEWKTKQVSVGGTATTPYAFDKTVKNCVKFTVAFQITKVKYGDPFGKYTVYGKMDGKWKKVGTFNANNKSLVTKTFTFKEPVSFTQLAFVGPPRMNGSYTFYAQVQDFYLHD